jgi:transcriptional regulator with XRE-family HTH domain
MKLSEFVAQYREEHNLSKRAFGAMTGISVQQISNIEKGIGNNGKPMTSTMKTYKKIADAIGMSEQDFLNLLNDNVTVNPNITELVRMRSPVRIWLSAPMKNAPKSLYLLAFRGFCLLCTALQKSTYLYMIVHH